MNPTERFSDRVADYINYRPRYPQRVLEFASEHLGLEPEHLIIDVGSGTGFLSQLFLDNCNIVYGVEPNREMREAGERLLLRYPGFRSIDGTAEDTGLPDWHADFVTAGQAFHWFDPVRARRELRRILRPGGWVMLIWNQRRIDSTPFLRAYEEFLRAYGIDYENVCQRGVIANDEAALRAFFAPDTMGVEVIPDHFQHFDFEGVKGRVLSSSYMPSRSHPRYEEMIDALRAIFDRYQSDGQVRFEYDTMIYYGHLDHAADAR